jgi:plastocyanin
MRGAPVALRGALALGAVAAVVVLAGCGGGGARAGDVPRISFRCQPVDFDCASKYLSRVVDENGPEVALRTIATLQRDGEIAQQVDDHQLAHAVGRETAKRFGVNGAAFQRCPNIFNYGCVHGFFEYALGQTATPRAAAVSICGSGGKRSEVDRFSCYHGVGHGVMMAKAYDLQGALDVCDTFPTAESEHGCWQGVFMENVNAGMAGKARPGVFVRDRPLAPCTNVAAQYRHECYINHAGWIVLVSSFDIARAARVCMGAERVFRSVCAQSLGLMVTNPSWQASLAKPLVGKRSFEEIAWNLCTRFPSRLRKDCVVAAVDNVANFDQLEVDRSDRFCGLVGESLRGACYKQIGLNLRRRTTSSGAAEDRCDDVARAGINSCVAGVHGRVESAVPFTRAKPTKPRTTTPAKQSKPAVIGAVVAMDDAGPYPKRVTIKSGQAVNFVNRSQNDWWPASDPHPIHTDYEGFDAGRVIGPGHSWTFRFDRPGTWTYHNHLSPTLKGTVVVK